MLKSQQINTCVIGSNSKIFIVGFVAFVSLISIYAICADNIKIVLGALTLLLVLFVVIKPYEFFLIYVFSAPFFHAYCFFTPHSIFVVDALKDSFFIMIVFVEAANLLSRKRNLMINTTTSKHCNLVMICFMCYMFMQVLRAPNWVVGILGFREIGEFMFAFFLAQSFLTTESRVRKCIQLIFISGVIAALIGVLQQVAGIHYTQKTIGFEGMSIPRLSSTLGNPNTFGFFLVISILIATNYLWGGYQKRSTRFCIFLSIIVMTGCLLLTYSRTSVVILIAGLTVTSIMRRSIKILLMLMVIGIPIFLLMPSSTSSRVIKIRHGVDAGRLDMWASAWEEIKQRPIIGVGYGQVGGLYATGRGGDLVNVVERPTELYSVIDSSYFFLLLENGVIGFGLYCLLLILIFRRGWLSIRQLKSDYLQQLSICLFSIFVALLLSATTANIFGMLFPINLYFWLLAGIMANSKNIELNSSCQT